MGFRTTTIELDLVAKYRLDILRVSSTEIRNEETVDSPYEWEWRYSQAPHCRTLLLNGPIRRKDGDLETSAEKIKSDRLRTLS